jgi:hypothetical protein
MRCSSARRTSAMTPATPLLGAIPELDSMAVVPPDHIARGAFRDRGRRRRDRSVDLRDPRQPLRIRRAEDAAMSPLERPAPEPFFLAIANDRRFCIFHPPAGARAAAFCTCIRSPRK